MMKFYRKTPMRLRCVIGAAVAAITLAGCANVAVKDTFDLNTVRPSSDETASKNARLKRVQILVANPSALQALDGQDIVVHSGNSTISNLKNSQWADRLPNMVQARLVQAFENTGQLGGVGRPGDGLAVNYQIISDIRAFGIDLNRPSDNARIEIAIKILDDRNGNVRASKVFSAQAPVQGAGNDAYGRALDKVFSTVVTEIVNWTFSSI